MTSKMTPRSALQPRPPGERTQGIELMLLRREAPLWLLAGAEDEDEAGYEPHIWRGID